MKLDKRIIKNGQTAFEYKEQWINVLRRHNGKIQKVCIKLGDILTKYSAISLYQDEIFKENL